MEKEMTLDEYLEYIKKCAKKAGGMQAECCNGLMTWEMVYEDAKLGICYHF